MRPDHVQLPIPSRRTLYREIEKIDKYTYLEGRYGKRIAKRETRHVGLGAKTSRPLERVEIDHTPLDIIIFDDQREILIGRPNLTLIIDRYLADHCPNCRKALHWKRAELGRCDCGQDLTKISTKSASNQAIAVCKHIEQLLHDNGEAVSSNEMPEPFKSMDLSEHINHLLFLAVYMSGQGRGTGRQMLYKLASGASEEVFERVSSSLFDWPNSFNTLLDSIRHHAGNNTSRTGLEAEFQSFYSGLYGKSLEASSLSAVKTAFSNYLHQYWDGGILNTKNKKIDTYSQEDRRYLSLAEAALKIEVHPSIIKKDILRGDLEAECKTVNGRMFTLIAQGDLENYRNSRNNLITTKEVREKLGLSKKPFNLLVKEGVIKAVKGPPIDGSTLWVFEHDHIMQLSIALFSNLPVRKIKPDEIEMGKVLRSASAKGIKLSEIIKALFSGSLRASCKQPCKNGIQSLCFRKDTMFEYLNKTSRTIDWALPIQKAAHQMHLNEEAVRDLVRHRFLKTMIVNSAGRPRKLISIDSMEQFLKTYALSTELALCMNTSSKAAVLLLKSEGIQPVTGPTVDGSRQYFYIRKEVLPYLKKLKAD